MAKVTPRVPHQTPMYEDDGSMSRTWIIFFERLGNWTEIIEEFGDKKATFCLIRDLEAVDDLTNHYIVRRAGQFYDVALEAKEPPVGAAARFDIERSEDGGETWTTIINSSPGYLEIGDGDGDVILYTDEDDQIFDTDKTVARVEVGDLLRINCDQAGSTTPGSEVSVVLRWD